MLACPLVCHCSYFVHEISIGMSYLRVSLELFEFDLFRIVLWCQHILRWIRGQRWVVRPKFCIIIVEAMISTRDSFLGGRSLSCQSHVSCLQPAQVILMLDLLAHPVGDLLVPDFLANLAFVSLPLLPHLLPQHGECSSSPIVIEDVTMNRKKTC